MGNNLDRMLSPRARRAGTDERGQSMIELAGVLVLFLVLIFGIVEGARLLWAYSVLANATREGVRFAAVRGSTTGTPAATAPTIAANVAAMAVGLVPTPRATVTWSPDAKPGGVVQITAEYDFSPVVPLFPLGNITLRSTAQMTIAR